MQRSHTLLYCVLAPLCSLTTDSEYSEEQTMKNRPWFHLPHSAHITEPQGEGAVEQESLRTQRFTHGTQRPLVVQQMSDEPYAHSYRPSARKPISQASLLEHSLSTTCGGIAIATGGCDMCSGRGLLSC